MSLTSALTAWAAELRALDAAARGLTDEAYVAEQRGRALRDAQAAVAADELAIEDAIDAAWVVWAAELAAGERLGLRHAGGLPVRVRATTMLRLDGLGARGAGNGAARGSVVHARIADARGYAARRLTRDAGQFLCRAGAAPFAVRDEPATTAITCPRCLAISGRAALTRPG